MDTIYENGRVHHLALTQALKTHSSKVVGVSTGPYGLAVHWDAPPTDAERDMAVAVLAQHQPAFLSASPASFPAGDENGCAIVAILPNTPTGSEVVFTIDGIPLPAVETTGPAATITLTSSEPGTYVIGVEGHPHDPIQIEVTDG